MGSLGIIANPMSGRDSRRLTARAESVSHESKRNQISRIVVGAVATGCTRILAPYDPRRLVLGALENMNIGAEVEEIRNPITHSAEDTRQSVREMMKPASGRKSLRPRLTMEKKISPWSMRSFYRAIESAISGPLNRSL